MGAAGATHTHGLAGDQARRRRVSLAAARAMDLASGHALLVPELPPGVCKAHAGRTRQKEGKSADSGQDQAILVDSQQQFAQRPQIMGNEFRVGGKELQVGGLFFLEPSHPAINLRHVLL